MGIEVIAVTGSPEELIMKIKYIDYVKEYSYMKDSTDRTSKSKESAEALIAGIERCYSLGNLIKDDIISLCWNLSLIYKYCKEIRCIDEDGTLKSFAVQNDSFKYITRYMGLSSTAAYAYSSIGLHFCTDDGKILAEYQGYGLSALIEMTSFFSSYWLSNKPYKVVPVSATIDEIRRYKKIMKMKNDWQEPFSGFSGKDGSLYDKVSETTSLPEVLKLYSEWEQGKAAKELEDKLSSKNVEAVEAFAPKAEKIEKILLRGRVYDVPAGYQAYVRELEEENDRLSQSAVPELGNCDGCQFKGTNLNKCRCCRRYKDLKDLYQK